MAGILGRFMLLCFLAFTMAGLFSHITSTLSRVTYGSDDAVAFVSMVTTGGLAFIGWVFVGVGLYCLFFGDR